MWVTCTFLFVGQSSIIAIACWNYRSQSMHWNLEWRKTDWWQLPNSKQHEYPAVKNYLSFEMEDRIARTPEETFKSSDKFSRSSVEQVEFVQCPRSLLCSGRVGAHSRRRSRLRGRPSRAPEVDVLRWGLPEIDQRSSGVLGRAGRTCDLV